MATSPARVETTAPYRRLRGFTPQADARNRGLTTAPVQLLSTDAAVRLGYAPRVEPRWFERQDLRDAATTFALTFTAAMILLF